MDQIVAGVFDSNSTVLERFVALIVLGAIATFIYMARASIYGGRDSEESKREERDREQRAEAIVRQVRREQAAKAERNEE